MEMVEVRDPEIWKLFQDKESWSPFGLLSITILQDVLFSTRFFVRFCQIDKNVIIKKKVSISVKWEFILIGHLYIFMVINFHVNM